MRDREFAIAKKALIAGTEDKTTLPESFSIVGRNAVHGKKDKVHTLVIAAPIPRAEIKHGRVEVGVGGKLLEPPREFEVNSWTRCFHNMLVSMLCATNLTSTSWGDGHLSAKATSGTVYGNNASWYGIRTSGERGGGGYSEDSGDDSYGLMIGTNAGSSPESFDDHDLDTPIANGVAAGEMYYATDPDPAVHTWDDPDWGHIRTRYFDNFNANANAISVEEIGIYCRAYTWNSTGPFMWARTVLDSPVSVPFRAQLGVSFTFELTYDDTGNLLRNLHNMVVGQCMSLNLDTPSPYGDGRLNLLSTSNTVATDSNVWYWLTGATQGFFNLHQVNRGYSALAGYYDRGIVVGSGNTAVAFNDYKLDTPIADGVAGGELQYGLTEVPVQNWADPVFTVSHARTFTNGSGGTVTVREVGTIAGISSPACLCLVFRDVVTAINIANGESLRVVFQPQVTFPA